MDGATDALDAVGSGSAKSEPFGVRPSMVTVRTTDAIGVSLLETVTNRPCCPSTAADSSIDDSPSAGTDSVDWVDNAIFPAVSEPQTAMSTVVGLVEGFETMSCCVVPVVPPESRNDWLSEVDTQDAADTPLTSPSSAHDAMVPTAPVPTAACSIRVLIRRAP